MTIMWHGGGNAFGIDVYADSVSATNPKFSCTHNGQTQQTQQTQQNSHTETGSENTTKKHARIVG